MADNTQLNSGTGGDLIATDELTLLNGGAVAGIKAQRVKVGFGVDGALQDVTSTAPLPSKITDGTNSATIKAGSTAAVAADNPVVVALHPSSPTPAGTNSIGTVNLASGSVAIGARSDGQLRVVSDPSTLLFDTFETIDTTNTWTVGGTVPPTGANGVLTVNAGTAASGNSHATSKPTFAPGSSALLQFAAIFSLAAAAQTGNKRIFGLGVLAGTPTAAVPISNGSVFEVGVDGLLYGACYSNSVRTQSVALTRPDDGLVHRYAIYYKTSRVYFELDNVQVGTLAFPNPLISALPLVVGSFNDTAVLGAAATLTATLMGLADTGRNSNQLSDGTFGWRKASVSKNGALGVHGQGTPVVYTNFAAAATGNTPAYDVSDCGNISFIIKNQIAGTAFTGSLVIVFEQSDDGVSWSALAVTRGDTLVTGTTLTLPPPGANAEIILSSAMPGVSFVRARVTTGTATGGLTIGIDGGGLLYTPQVSSVNRKDTGRNVSNLFMALPIVTTASDVLISLTGYKNGAAVAATTAPAVVTAGKTYRIIDIHATYLSVASGGGVRISLRANTAGVAVVGSPIVASWFVGGPTSATAGLWSNVNLPLPDGLEFAAGTGLGITIVGINASAALAVAGYATCTINGYEY